MSDSWQRWIHDSLESTGSNPFIELLKARIASGERIVKLSAQADASGLVYQVLLARGTELSATLIPHSMPFYRFCLSLGLRMNSPEEESVRYSILTAYSLGLLEAEVGETYLKSLLLEQVRHWGPPKTCAALSSVHEYLAAEGPTKTRARTKLESIFVGFARDLNSSLHYPEIEVSAILDSAILENVKHIYRYQLKNE